MRKSLLLIFLLAAGSMAVAQDAARFQVTVENVGRVYPFLKSGVFNTPDGAEEPAPIFPGEAYVFSFSAGPGMNLSLATMFVQSNDLFYAFAPEGLPLFGDDGMPIGGDVTASLSLWDAGTEVDEEPGTGANQAPRQAAGDTGEVENENITEIEDGGMSDGFTYPTAESVVEVTIENDGVTGFSVRIENVSSGETLATTSGSVAVPLAPGAWAVHSPTTMFFEAGAAASEGIERIAEDGDPSAFSDYLAERTGVSTLLAPVGFAVHTDASMLFEDGSAGTPGLEKIAEDGDPSVLTAELNEIEDVSTYGAAAVPVGAAGPGPLFPDNSYSFVFTASPGDVLSLATMFVQSNDLFYSFAPEGVMLFDGSSLPVEGDITSMISLWDAGTEVNEEPGVGLNQAPRQSGGDTGMDEDGMVMQIEEDGSTDGYVYPAAAEVVRVSIAPVETVPLTIRIENVSTGETLPTSTGSVAVPLAPGAFAVHTPDVPFFEEGATASSGIERIAEDGDPSAMNRMLRGLGGVVQHGVFTTPVGGAAPAPVFPGEAYEFDIQAAPGDYLSFATMFVQSNDLFYAPAPMGMSLFDDGGLPITGDVSGGISLWDAGTEVDEEPGTGPNQAPRQAAADTGEMEGGSIVEIEDGGMNNGFAYPMVSDVLTVTVTAGTNVANEDDRSALPDRYQLHGNYPNPFNPSTRITFETRELTPLSIEVYDVMGRLVATLADRAFDAGQHEVTFNADYLPSGVYVAVMQSPAGSQSIKMSLLK